MRKWIFNFSLWLKVIKNPPLCWTSSPWLWLSTVGTFTSRSRGLTGRRCCWNPCLNLKVANQPNSYCCSCLKSKRSQPLLLSVQRADRITLVTLIIVKRGVDNGRVPSYWAFTFPVYSFLSSPPFTHLWLHFTSCYLHTLSFKSIFPMSPLYFCHMLLFMHRFSHNNLPEDRIHNVDSVSLPFVYFLTAASRSTVALLPSWSPPSCAKHSCSHTREWELALSVHL